MSQGWECPRCSSIHSPSISECAKCNTIKTDKSPFSIAVGKSQCCACSSSCSHTGTHQYCNEHKASGGNDLQFICD